MKVSTLRGWLFQARMDAGNPAAGIFLVTADWNDAPAVYEGEDVVIGWWGDGLCLNVGGELFNFQVKAGDFEVLPDGKTIYGLDKLAASAWAVRPSIVRDGSLHAYVVFHNAPSPAPWEIK